MTQELHEEHFKSNNPTYVRDEKTAREDNSGCDEKREDNRGCDESCGLPKVMRSKEYLTKERR